MRYRSYHPGVKKELGNRSSPSHWVLMTRDVIPNSRDKTYDDQKALVQKHAQTSGEPYELPHALDAATCILMHYIDTREALYKSSAYTRCQEKVDNNQWPLAIGGFSLGSLHVNNWLERPQHPRRRVLPAYRVKLDISSWLKGTGRENCYYMVCQEKFD